MRNSAKWFLLLHLILGVYASSSVCSKLARSSRFERWDSPCCTAACWRRW